jgi:hypothetical protein
MPLTIYDRYNSDDQGNTTRATKPWKKLKFVPGRVVQVPELNEMQSVLHDNVRELGDTLFKNGSIISGLQPTVLPAEVKIGEAGVPNKLYAYGYIIDLPNGTVAITGAQEEKVGVLLTPTLVTEVEDPDLTDPVTGARNRGLPGAYRLTYVGSYVLDNPDAFTLHTLRFGQLVSLNLPPQFDSLNQTLATRTNDESGSYLVDGMDTKKDDTTVGFVMQFRGARMDELASTVSTDDNPLVRLLAEPDEDFAARIAAETITVTVEAGLAYVAGYRVQKPSPTKLLLPKAKDLKSVNNEFHTLIGTHLLGNPVNFTLYSTPVANISGATMQVRTTVNPLRSPFVSTDFLATDGPITNIATVEYTAPGPTLYTYTQGTHFNFTGTGLLWLDPTNINPAITVPQGATYTVILDYNQTLEIGDVTLNKDIYLSSDTEITLTGSVGGNPVTYTPSGDMVIDYNWYQNRIDTIYIDQFSEIKRKLGEPSRFPIAHKAPEGSLVLAEISLAAGSTSIGANVRDLKLKRLTMNEIQDLVKRLERAEYNQAISNLNVQAQLSVGNAIPLKGIFTDSFVNLDKTDTNNSEYQANPTAIGKGDSTGEIEISEESEQIVLDFNAVNSINEKVINVTDSLSVTADYTLDTSRISQLKATTAVKVNPYSTFSTTPFIYCTPSQLVANSTSQILTLTNTTNGSAIGPLTQGSFTQEWLQTKIAEGTRRITLQGTNRFASATIPTKPIKLKGQVFAANQDNLALTVDGIPLNVIPDSVTPSGTLAGTNLHITSSYTGTVTINSGTNTVTGVATNFSSTDVGKAIKVGTETRLIASFSSTTSVTVDSNWSTSAAGSTYTVGYKTVKANAFGLINAQFDIPANTILSGKRVVKLIAQPAGLVEAELTIEFIDPLTTEVALTPQVTLTPPVVVNTRLDPVAQTFAFDKDTLLTGVDLYFKAKSATEPVIVEITPTIAGFELKGQLLYVHTSITKEPPDVNITATPMTNPTSNTVRTRFEFKDPALCLANVTYAVVIKSNSPDYEVWTAKLGERTIDNSEFVNAQVAQGVLLTSANGETWTPDQTSDLMFALVTATPTLTTADIRFDPVTFANPMSELQLVATQNVVEGSAVVWEYSTDNFVSSQNRATLDPTGKTFVQIDSPVTGPVYIRAKITNNSATGASSLVQLGDIKLTGTASKSTGNYVSKTIPLDTAPTSVRATVDLKLSPGTSVNAYYGFVNLAGQIVDAGGITLGWTPLPLQPGFLPAQDPSFTGYAYEDTGIVTTLKNLKIKLELVGNPSLKTSPQARRLISIFT